MQFGPMIRIPPCLARERIRSSIRRPSSSRKPERQVLRTGGVIQRAVTPSFLKQPARTARSAASERGCRRDFMVAFSPEAPRSSPRGDPTDGPAPRDPRFRHWPRTRRQQLPLRHICRRYPRWRQSGCPATSVMTAVFNYEP